MNSGETTNWPGQATDPAFALPPSRDFDGGLLHRHSYTLTRADALALLRLRRPWSTLARAGFGLTCVAGGMLTALLSVGFAGFLLTQSALIAGFFLARDLSRRRQAARMVPHPRPAQFEEWTDCIAATQIDAEDEAYLSPELIGAVVQTRAHIFIHSHSTTLVIPTRALPDPDAMTRHLRNLARGPYYFDP